MQDREFRIKLFENTIETISNDEYLKKAVNNSKHNSSIYASYGLAYSKPEKRYDTKITVTKERTLEAAKRVSQPHTNITVLNFANAFRPGGGVTEGCTAQEENLCRCSTLLPVLYSYDLWRNYYYYNKHNCSHTGPNSLIYSPSIYVIRNDIGDTDVWDKSEWFSVNVITMAAPDLRFAQITDSELECIHQIRANLLFNVALNKDVDILILGAFGCGAFNNNPEIVANAWKKELDYFKELGFFKEIIFAVYCGNYGTNYRVFHDFFTS